MNHPDDPRLSPQDAELLDRLLAGESPDDLFDANEPDRALHVSRLLSLLEQWQADDSEPGLSQRTLFGVLAAYPVSLSVHDGEALDALLTLRRQGLTDGPMPVGIRERLPVVQQVAALLDRAADEPVPAGLTQRTMLAIERDRLEQQQRSALSSLSIASHRQGSLGIRQIATTAALLLMALSILLPVLSNAKRDAQIAQCRQNLAGLGSDLQQIAFDNKGLTPRRLTQPDDVLSPLARFARSALDGSVVPASEASFFVLMDQQRITSEHMTCPSGSRNDRAALYNGQNPVAGGPFRVFLQARPIFADTNPLYQVTPQGLVRRSNIPSLTRSANHAGSGQNLLISDGSVQWMVRPAVQRNAQDSDNIWLYQAKPSADSGEDIFLTP